MAIRVVTVPNPAAGADWRYTVPGQWQANLIGVTATCSTPAGIASYPDASGHGHTATLNAGAGLNVLGASGPYSGGSTNYGVTQPSASTASFNPTGGANLFSMDMWEYFTGGVGGSGTFYMFIFTANGGNQQMSWGYYFGGLNPCHGWTNPQALADFSGIFVVCVIDNFMPLNGWHHFAAVINAVNGDGHFDVYLDGALVQANVTNNAIGGAVTVSVGGSPVPPGKRAAVAFYPSQLSAAQISAHYAARTTHDAYKTAVLADSPSALWMLDDLGTQFSKQVNLVITDGTTTVATFPAGLASTISNAQTWSWEVLGTSNLQSTDGSVQTVSIPELQLPAGYTVGTRTLDLASGDQWSNIKLWFDDGGGGTIPGGGNVGGYLNALLVPDYSHRGG